MSGAPTQPLRPPLPRLLVFTLARIWYPLLLLPVLLLYGLIYGIEHGVHPGSKDLAENASLAVLAAGIVVTLLRWLKRQRAPFLAWLAMFTGTLLLRELHAEGASTTPLYLLMLALLLALWWRYAWFGPWLAARINLSLLAGALFTYFVAVGCDKNVWTFVTDNIRLLQHVEEFVELAGHLQILLLALLARAAPNPLLQPAPAAAPATVAAEP